MSDKDMSASVMSRWDRVKQNSDGEEDVSGWGPQEEMATLQSQGVEESAKR